MLKITRFTDYALVVLCCLVKNQHNNPDVAKLSTNEVARLVGLTIPTVSKILKLLVKSELVRSYRGSDGGYELAKEPASISVNQVIECLEGPVMLTACSKTSEKTQDVCEHINNCELTKPWRVINTAITNILNKISLNDIAYNNLNI